MTNPRDDLMALAPCPFCGGEAERIDIPTVGSDPELGGDPNVGGSCISCKRCAASTALHFDRKENLYSSWNDRAASRPAPVDREVVAQFLTAWDSLPIGKHSLRTLEKWLNSDAMRDSVAVLRSLLCPAEPVEAWNPVTSPGMPDLTVPPESLDAFMEANPLPTSDAVGEPVAASPYEGKMIVDAKLLHALWCYGNLHVVEGVIYSPGSHQECLAQVNALFRERATHPPASPDTSAAILAERERCAAIADEWANKMALNYGRETANTIAAAIRQLPTPERGDK